MKELLLKQNYHWTGNPFNTGVKREICSRIVSSMQTRHIKAITGVRRCGKSYLFRQIIQYLIKKNTPAGNILQINFEDPFFISHRDTPDIIEKLFKEYCILKNPQGKIYLFLDEIQNISGWQFWVRSLYDSNEEAGIFITGSNSDMLSSDLATHLTGRVIPFEVFPFSYREYFSGMERSGLYIPEDRNAEELHQKLFGNKNELIHNLEKIFRTGLFPETVFLDDEELIKNILLQYFQGIIFKDIIPRFEVRNTKIIEELAYYMATNFTSLFSYRKIAESLGTDGNTIKEYISMLEKSYLFFAADYYEYSLQKQFRRNRKPYIIDCGMRSAVSFTFSDDTGKLAENSIFMALRRKYDRVYYWQDDRTHKEIDFIIKDKNRLIAINSSYTDTIPAREFDAFTAFRQYARTDRNIIISRDTFIKQKAGDIEIEVIPFWVFAFMEI